MKIIEPVDLSHLTEPTELLNFRHPTVQSLVAGRRWRELGIRDRIGAAYKFVRDEIAFGYNKADDLPASQVLADGIGQCNTKGAHTHTRQT
jgi:transglutaminase-like putative cysteine protease